LDINSNLHASGGNVYQFRHADVCQPINVCPQDSKVSGRWMPDVSSVLNLNDGFGHRVGIGRRKWMR
jgi:hypothetical protein